MRPYLGSTSKFTKVPQTQDSGSGSIDKRRVVWDFTIEGPPTQDSGPGRRAQVCNMER
jgi:hypothetical protein